MKNEAQQNPSEDVKKLAALIKDIKIAMLTTIDTDGNLRSRPMASQEMEFDGDLWFFTSKSSGLIHTIIADQKVGLSYSAASLTHPHFVSITGRADMVEDREKMQELWNPMYRTWFPEGLEDPDLVLLRVRVDSAEYWDSPSGAVIHLLGFVKAEITGRPLEGELGENKKIEMRH